MLSSVPKKLRNQEGSQQDCQEKGAAMLEFILSAGVFFLLLGGIVDVGLILQKKSLLTNASKQISRLISIRVANENSCSEISNTINHEGKNLVENKLGFDNHQWEVKWADSGISQSFNLSISSKMPCFFLCKISENGWRARANSTSTVNTNLKCSNVKL